MRYQAEVTPFVHSGVPAAAPVLSQSGWLPAPPPTLPPGAFIVPKYTVHQTPAPAPVSYPEPAVLPGAGSGSDITAVTLHLSREQLEQLGSILRQPQQQQLPTPQSELPTPQSQPTALQTPGQTSLAGASISFQQQSGPGPLVDPQPQSGPGPLVGPQPQSGPGPLVGPQPRPAAGPEQQPVGVRRKPAEQSGGSLASNADVSSVRPTTASLPTTSKSGTRPATRPAPRTRPPTRPATRNSHKPRTGRPDVKTAVKQPEVAARSPHKDKPAGRTKLTAKPRKKTRQPVKAGLSKKKSEKKKVRKPQHTADFSSFPHRGAAAVSRKAYQTGARSAVAGREQQTSLEDKQASKAETLAGLLAIAGGGLGSRAGERGAGSSSARLRRKIPQFSCPEPEGHFAEPADCGVYYRCVHDTPTRVECGAGLVWDQASLQCDWEEEVQCQPAII